jgi:hypothetical protein
MPGMNWAAASICGRFAWLAQLVVQFAHELVYVHLVDGSEELQ